jgi:predicted hydrolase (HD superfamily)
MLTLAEADALIDRHLGEGFRADHSRLVASLMRRLAARLSADLDLWELTGLCHDLDYEVTRAAPEQHGVVVAHWLVDRLPAGALIAIEAHDHRSGITSDAALAQALKLADALAILDISSKSAAVAAALAADDPGPALLACDRSRPWLATMILDNAAALGIPPADLAATLHS